MEITEVDGVVTMQMSWYEAAIREGRSPEQAREYADYKQRAWSETIERRLAALEARVGTGAEP